jgi:hypothetical protein
MCVCGGWGSVVLEVAIQSNKDQKHKAVTFDVLTPRLEPTQKQSSQPFLLSTATLIQAPHASLPQFSDSPDSFFFHETCAHSATVLRAPPPPLSQTAWLSPATVFFPQGSRSTHNHNNTRCTDHPATIPSVCWCRWASCSIQFTSGH